MKWRVGNHSFKINPKQNNNNKTALLNSTMGVNGEQTSAVPYYSNHLQFTVDIVEKNTRLIKKFSHIDSADFVSISHDFGLNQLHILDGNLIHVYSEDGTLESIYSVKPKNVIRSIAISEATGLNAANAVDGNDVTFWNMQDSKGSISLDLGFHISLSRVSILCEGKQTLDVSIYSDDSELLNDSYETSEEGDIWIDFPATSMRQLRVEINNASSQQIYNIEAYYIPSVNPTGIVHLMNEVAFFYENDEGKGTLMITDNYGSELQKYVYSDVDGIESTRQLAWDVGTPYIYTVSKYGKVYQINKLTGAYTLIHETEDYRNNKSYDLNVYQGIDIYNSHFFVLSKQNQIDFFDVNFNKIYSIDLLGHNLINLGVIDQSNQWFVLTDQHLSLFEMNLAKLQLEDLKSEAKKGMVTITDDNNIKHKAVIKQIGINRFRNLNEARYEVSCSGDLVT
ncbi:hypothetical protein [Chengkuizengella axinellae]|uniref:F5/8 type C domain-containing protein n=1 Tax=Chengkuizengella axinellae TaxID=3064388 RepID=A0ABT9IXZ1_9BACL|nr:hypothetical protein [Chengkuizengella sp. 2205SS18-9]MDP5273674.1 hypothetical protein [Chengkuizengella sp. 2205SS18-9]